MQLHSVCGFQTVVENSRVDIQTALVLQRLEEALQLIQRYQPWRYRHLQRDVMQFWIVRYPCRGAYFPDRRTCMTELTFLANGNMTTAQIAASIVHEGMHARMHNMRLNDVGLASDSWDRPREERICRRAEYDFGLALPAELGAPVVQRAQSTLAASDDEVAPEIDWSEARLRQDIADLKSLNLPSWLIRCLINFRTWRPQA